MLSGFHAGENTSSQKRAFQCPIAVHPATTKSSHLTDSI
jgi:hypothetical protein